VRWLLASLCAGALAAADARVGADRDYATALAEYQQAELADADGDGAGARAHLTIARQALDAALAAYRDLAAQPDAEVVERRRVELQRLGRPCCGRIGLWERYGIPPQR
jgi:hypothetical protein